MERSAPRVANASVGHDRTVSSATTPSELYPKIKEMLARIGRDTEAGARSAAQGGAEGAPIERRRRSRFQARALLRRLADEDLEAITTDELLALATSAFAFADSRGPRRPPSASYAEPDVHGYRCHGTVIEVHRRLRLPRRLRLGGAWRAVSPSSVCSTRRSGRSATSRDGWSASGPDGKLSTESRSCTSGSTALRRRECRARDASAPDPPRRRAGRPGLRSDAGHVRHMIEPARAAEVRYPSEVVGEGRGSSTGSCN